MDGLTPARGIRYEPAFNREDTSDRRRNRKGTGSGLVVLFATPSEESELLPPSSDVRIDWRKKPWPASQA